MKPQRGRRPKPTALRRLEGNRGKRAWNHDEPVPPEAQPRCPSHLSPDATAILQASPIFVVIPAAAQLIGQE